MSKSYKWRDGYGFAAVTPADVAGELDRIAQDNGSDVARPTDVVNASRPEDAVLHPVFEWDDEIAAECWRTEQARSVIRSVVVVEEDAPETPVPLYVNVRVDRSEQSYMPTERVARDPELMQLVLDEAMRGLEAWQARYRHLAQLAPIMAAIDGARVMQAAPKKPRRRPANPAARPQPVA